MKAPLAIVLAITATTGATAQTAQPATETEFREAVQQAEEIARGLRSELRRYRGALRRAMRRQGYGPYRSLFRSSINGFAEDHGDLDSSDELKMGRFAFTLKTEGTELDPDPFPAWLKVQNWITRYETTMDAWRDVIVRGHLVTAHAEQNIPLLTYKQLNKRWRNAEQRALEGYERAVAVRPVYFEDGVMVPAEVNPRSIPGFGAHVSGP
jgi:hypothetical protein